MSLKVVHDSIDDIPENYRELYTERDDKFYLTGVEGVKTQDDVDRVSEGLRKEREDHKKTKERLNTWDGMEFEDVQKNLSRIPELEAMAKGNREEWEKELDELTENRVKSRILPVEGDLKKTKKDLETTTEELLTLRTEIKRRTIHEKIREEAQKAKVLSSAMPDVLLLADAVFDITETGDLITKQNPYNVLEGMSIDVFFQQMPEHRPHWWQLSGGGGANGSSNIGGMKNNPWAKDHWNLTEQGKIISEKGLEKAEQIAKAAGSKVGAVRPK